MINLFRVQDGFPHNRVEAAKKLILSYKPWWSGMLNSMPIVPINVPVPEDGEFGGMTSTDRDMHLYIDTNFATSAPLEILAGSIERELQRHIRDTWSRFSWLSAEEWDRQVNICIDLEIASSLNREYDSGIAGYRNRNIFTDDMASKWGVTGHPSLSGVGWEPSMLDLEEGKSAEEYYKLMNEPLMNEQEDDSEDETDAPDDEAPDNDQEDGQEGGLTQSPEKQEGDEEEEKESDEESTGEDGKGGTGQEEEQGESSDDGEKSEGNSSDGPNSEDPDSDQDGESSESEDGSGNDPSGDSDESNDSEDSSSDSSSEGDSDGEGEPDSDSDGESEQSDSDENGSGDPDSAADGPAKNDEIGKPKSNGQGYQSNDENNDRYAGQDSGAESVSQDSVGNGLSSSLDSGDATGGSNTSGSSGDPRDRMEMAESMMNQSPELSWMADDLQSPKETKEPSWEPDEQDKKPGIPDTKKNDIKKELAEEIKSRFPQGSPALKGMESVAEWADREKKKSPDHWTNRLSKLGSLAADSAQIDGSGDLTYMKRNPNQPQVGAILMGMVDYSPTIYTLNDQSYSMTRDNGLLRSANMFLDLTKSMFSRFGTTSLWIGVDTDIRYVGKPKSPRQIHKSDLPALYASGGTDFGDVIDDIQNGRMKFEGKKYKKPDLLVINTDCQFAWPDSWMERKTPIRKMKLIVCSVIPHARAKEWLPEWVNPKNNNFIEIDYR